MEQEEVVKDEEREDLEKDTETIATEELVVEADQGTEEVEAPAPEDLETENEEQKEVAKEEEKEEVTVEKSHDTLNTIGEATDHDESDVALQPMSNQPEEFHLTDEKPEDVAKVLEVSMKFHLSAEEKPEETVKVMEVSIDEKVEEEEISAEETDMGTMSPEKYEEMQGKESVFTRGRGSISYEMGPRIRDLEETVIDTGEFLILEEDEPLKFYKYMDEKDEEEAPEESASEEEEQPIDRQPYYERHEVLLKEINTERIKNNILQKKLAKFFKRRKMDHVLKETDQQFDTQEKYGKKLDAYGELTELDQFQRMSINTELDQLKAERELRFNELNQLFESLQTQEKDTGYGLIHTKTGKPIPDKMVERLLNRQRHQMQTVGVMRLKYIQLKNMVAEKQNAISLLDKIGENLYLMDYEQLKVENRSYMDKMEEKDEELSRLRNKCQKTIQILAHMREKSAALDSDIYDLQDDLATLNIQSMEVRSSLNQLKQQRDYYRNMTNKLRDESGLLTQSDLLRDMEVSIEELKTLTEELELLKEEHKVKAQQIRNIRKNIEFPPEWLTKKSLKSSADKSTHRRHLYKGRPSLHRPTLPEDAFKHLRHFKGKYVVPKFQSKNSKAINI